MKNLIWQLGVGQEYSVELEIIFSALRLGLITSHGGKLQLTRAGRDMFEAIAY
jgi:hypothetical protein